MSATIKKLFTYLQHFLATGFGSGLSPVAPGTAGTVVGVIIFFPNFKHASFLSNRIHNFFVLFRGLDHCSRG